jgi:hypothetical protein
VTERRYDDDEVALILKRAAESSAVQLAGRSDGLTLSQLRQVAAEAGMDPNSVENAAQALDTRVAESISPLLGTPLSPQYERAVPGQLREEDLGEIVLAIRRAMGRQGVITQDLGGFQWRARDGLGARYLTIQRVGDRTLVRGLGNFRDGALATSLLSGALGATATLAILKAAGLLAAIGLGAAPLLALGAYLPARALWRRFFRREDQRLRETVAEAAAVVERRAVPEPRDDAVLTAGLGDR